MRSAKCNITGRETSCRSQTAKLSLLMLSAMATLAWWNGGQAAYARDPGLADPRSSSTFAAHEEVVPWTVITVAPDGAWGVGIETASTAALSKAIANCKAMSKRRLGCGARTARVQGGWSAAVRCGGEYVFAAGKSEIEVERRIVHRVMEIRTHYDTSLPACNRMFTVDPLGTVTIYDAPFDTGRL